MSEHPRITVQNDRRGGQPCVRDLRISVADVLEYLAGGMTEDDLLAEFAELESADVRACLAFAADRERRLRGGAA